MPYILGWYYSAERFLSVHNCVLVILNAERFSLYNFLHWSTERFLSVHIFSLGVNQRGFSLAFGDRGFSLQTKPERFLFGCWLVNCW